MDVKDGEILLPGEESEQEKKAAKIQSRFWPVFRRALRQVPLGRDVVAGFFCAMDPSSPTRVRAALLAALAYFVLPLDGLPDFLAIVGFTDDLTILAATIALVRAHLTREHYAKADVALADENE